MIIMVPVGIIVLGVGATIGIPTYFQYTKKGYASDAKVQMKNILENSKLYYSERDEFPEDVETLNESGYANVPESTLRRWQFSIDLTYDEGVGLSGAISAESLDEMRGGAGKTIIYDVTLGKFMGYGTSEEAEGGQ